MKINISPMFSERGLTAILAAVDVIIILASESIAFYLKFSSMESIPSQYAWLSMLSCLVYTSIVAMTDGYNIKNYFNINKSLATVTRSGLKALFIIFILCIFMKISYSYSRDWLFYSTVLTAAGLYSSRLLLLLANRRLGIKSQVEERVILYGTCELAEMIVKRWDESAEKSFILVGVFDDRKTRQPDGHANAHFKGDSSRLLNFVRLSLVDRVLITLPWDAHDRIAALLEQLRILPVKIDICLPVFMWGMPIQAIQRVGDIPVITLANPAISRDNRLIKTLEDYVIGSLLLLMLLPALAAIAVAIKLDSRGPVLFRQTRNGFNNTQFTVYKFRTMHADVGEHDVRQATHDDPRITRVGRVLRRLSLDELPQFFNVLNGTMSIVGPRPHAVEHNLLFSKDIKTYFARHNMKPGITGLAQINGFRGEITSREKMKARIEYDLQYLDNWSLWLDLKIILLTVIKVWFQKEAY